MEAPEALIRRHDVQLPGTNELSHRPDRQLKPRSELFRDHQAVQEILLVRNREASVGSSKREQHRPRMETPDSLVQVYGR